jgi:glycosyltransferase involved in cell wall biosynthesis
MAAAFSEKSASSTERPDVIFAAVPSLELAESAVAFGRAQGIPVIVDARDKWPDVYLNAVPAALRGLLRHTLHGEFSRARRVFRNATGIVGISDGYLDWALSYAGRKRKELDAVAPLGFPVPDRLSTREIDERGGALRRTLGIGSEQCVITFLGMFGLSYDLECVITAARRLRDERRRGDDKICIVLAGTGDSEARMRTLAVGLPNVRFTGWLNQGDAWALLHASRAGLAPYRSDALQSLPNKAFEYMAAGLPIISSLGGELERLLAAEGAGLTYRAGDAESLADALRRVAANDVERRAMGTRGRKLYDQNYSTMAIYAQLARHLRVAAAGGAPVPNDDARRQPIVGGIR